MKQTAYILTILVISAILVAGCTTTECIPIKPTAITRDQSGSCHVTYENVSHPILGDGRMSDCSKFKDGQVTWVKFDTLIKEQPIVAVCEGKL